MTAAELKASILDLAIRGKLVAQDPNDEPASELLKRIKAEKVKTAKGKKTAALQPITDDDKPFEIPDGWEWVRLGGVSELLGGFAFKSNEYVAKGVRVVRISDFDEHGFVDKDVRYYQYTSDLAKYLIVEKDILMCMTGGTVGKSFLVKDLKSQMLLNQRVACIRSVGVVQEFIEIVVHSFLVQGCIQKSKNSTNDNISMELIRDFLLPLPPLAEQKRIVEKVEELMPLVDRYEKAEAKRIELEKALPGDLEKSILQEAIQGKLVEQDPKDEPASEIIARIAAEKAKLIKEKKIKKEKPLDPIDENEVPFALPKGWAWCRLGDVITLTSGQDLVPQRYNSEKKGIPYLTGASNISNERVIINRWTESPTSCAIKGDLLFTCKGTVGAMAFLEEDRVHIARQIMGVRGWQGLEMGYVKYYLLTRVEDLQTAARSMIPGIGRDDLLRSVVPLPPFAEQKRIVAKVDELLGALKRLH